MMLRISKLWKEPTSANAPIATALPIIHTNSILCGEKSEKFNGVDFRRWQRKILFYLTTLNLAIHLNENAFVVQEEKIIGHY